MSDQVARAGLRHAMVRRLLDALERAGGGPDHGRTPVILLPRTKGGWLALVAFVLLAAAVGQLVSASWGAFAFGLAATVAACLVIVTAEAWRADIWRGTRPPARIDPSQSVDYLVWRFRHRDTTG